MTKGQEMSMKKGKLRPNNSNEDPNIKRIVGRLSYQVSIPKKRMNSLVLGAPLKQDGGRGFRAEIVTFRVRLSNSTETEWQQEMRQNRGPRKIDDLTPEERQGNEKVNAQRPEGGDRCRMMMS